MAALAIATSLLDFLTEIDEHKDGVFFMEDDFPGHLDPQVLKQAQRLGLIEIVEGNAWNDVRGVVLTRRGKAIVQGEEVDDRKTPLARLKSFIFG